MTRDDNERDRFRWGGETPEIVILTRSRAESYEPQHEDEICISITSPADAPARLSSRFKDVLRLAFADIREPSPMPQPHMFGHEHAQQIVAFLKSCGPARRIIVHCSIGASRSPGVALGICDLFGWSPWPLQRDYPAWNTWVRTELVRVGREVLDPTIE